MTKITPLKCCMAAAAFVFTLIGPVPVLHAAGTCETIEAKRCTVELSTGIDMAYLETGPRGGQAVILIHGLTDNIRSWSLSMDSLHKLDPQLRILAIDLRGHGHSSMPEADRCAPAPEECFRPEDFAADLVAFMDAMEIRDAALVGHSLGSFIVQEMAFRHPERVSNAVLVATAASGVGNPILNDYVLKEPIEGSWKASLEAKGKAYPADFYAMTPKDADANVQTWLAANWVVDPTAEPDFLRPYLVETAEVKLGTWIGATKALLAQDNTERLKETAVPTLVLWATQDNIFPASDQDAVKASLKIAAQKSGMPTYWKEYGIVPLPASGAQESDVGHNVQWSAFDAVARDIESFIRTGRPTDELVRSESTENLGNLVTESGKATVVQLGK